MVIVEEEEEVAVAVAVAVLTMAAPAAAVAVARALSLLKLFVVSERRASVEEVVLSLPTSIGNDDCLADVVALGCEHPTAEADPSSA